MLEVQVLYEGKETPRIRHFSNLFMVLSYITQRLSMMVRGESM